jgi:hypothetical protein
MPSPDRLAAFAPAFAGAVNVPGDSAFVSSPVNAPMRRSNATAGTSFTDSRNAIVVLPTKLARWVVGDVSSPAFQSVASFSPLLASRSPATYSTSPALSPSFVSRSISDRMASVNGRFPSCVLAFTRHANGSSVLLARIFSD